MNAHCSETIGLLWEPAQAAWLPHTISLLPQLNYMHLPSSSHWLPSKLYHNEQTFWTVGKQSV
jgi:hypothetical protein